MPRPAASQEALVSIEEIVALDFETANEQRASACSVALVKADASGKILGQTSTLLKPAAGFDYFNRMNIAIHGITPSDVAEAPTFEEALPALREFIGDAPVIAHNMAFDYSVWNAAAAAVDQPGLTAPRLCTLRIARQVLRRGRGEPNDLATLTQEFAPSFEFTHHQALADATACLHVLFGMLPALEVDLDTLVTEFAPDADGRHAPHSRYYAAGDAGLASAGILDAAAVEAWEESEVLGGWNICFTGALDRMNRTTAKALVKKLGGTPQDTVTKKTRILVEGVGNPVVWRPGVDGSRKTQKARELAESGQEIEAMNEETFFDMLSELAAAE